MIIANEKLFLLCSVASFWKAASSLPSRLPSTMLLDSQTGRMGGGDRSIRAHTLAAITTSRVWAWWCASFLAEVVAGRDDQFQDSVQMDGSLHLKASTRRDDVAVPSKPRRERRKVMGRFG